MRWPPPDTRRNRAGARVLAALFVVVGVYVLLVATVSHALVPWVAFAVCVAALVVVLAAIGLMRHAPDASAPAQEETVELPTAQLDRAEQGRTEGAGGAVDPARRADP